MTKVLNSTYFTTHSFFTSCIPEMIPPPSCMSNTQSNTSSLERGALIQYLGNFSNYRKGNFKTVPNIFTQAHRE